MRRLSALVPAGRSERVLSAASFLYGTGFGSFAASSALFFTRSVGLSAGQVGTGTAVAGIVAVAAAVTAGRIADRVGARNLLVVLSVAQAVMFAQYSLVSNVPSFVVVVCLLTMADQGARVARNTVIAGMSTGSERVRLKAYLRSVTNIGMSLGTLVSAVPLALDTRSGYLAVIFANAVAAAITAVLVTRLPNQRAAAAPRRGWVALRDRSYMQVAVLSGLLITSRSLMTIAMPLWVATHTSVPRTVVAALLVGNTILSIVLQVPTSKRADTAESARRTARRGGLLILPAGAMFAAATAVPVPAAILLLAVGVAGLAAAELFASVAAWSLSFELADSRVPGQYQGAFSLGLAVETVVGPLLATGVVLGLGASGWLLAGLLLGVVGIGLAATVKRVLAAQTGAAEPTVRLAMDVTLRLAYPEAATDLLSIGTTTTRAPERPPAVDVPMLLPVYAVGRATPARSSNRQFAFVRTSTQTAVH